MSNLSAYPIARFIYSIVQLIRYGNLISVFKPLCSIHLAHHLSPFVCLKKVVIFGRRLVNESTYSLWSLGLKEQIGMQHMLEQLKVDGEDGTLRVKICMRQEAWVLLFRSAGYVLSGIR